MVIITNKISDSLRHYIKIFKWKYFQTTIVSITPNPEYVNQIEIIINQSLN